MAWWISFTLIHTKAVLNQSKKGSCMNQSQNAIFISPTGEENLMNSNHRDSESITGEFILINIEVLFAYRIKCKCLNPVYRTTGMKPWPPFPASSPERPAELISSFFRSHDQNLPCVPSLVCSDSLYCVSPWSAGTVSYLSYRARTELLVFVYSLSTCQQFLAHKRHSWHEKCINTCGGRPVSPHLQH